MTDEAETRSQTTWRKRIDWWELFVAVAPILAGIGMVVILSLVDVIFRPDTTVDWNQRILLGMVAIITGISLQFKGISKEFQKLKNQSDKNTKKLAAELSDAIGIPVESASSENYSTRRIYGIAEKSNRIEKNLEHLTPKSRAIIRDWAAEYLSGVESEVSDFARRSKRFDGIRGLEADEDLISSATKAILATTPVSRESMDFWLDTSGKKYRESLTNLLSVEPVFKEDSDTLNCAGVARIFTFSGETISEVEDGIESGIVLIEEALAEAKVQQDMGIGVKFLIQSDLADDDLAQLDVLIVDGCICSKTISQDPVNTRARSVVVNWDKSGLQRIAGDWRLIWRRAATLEEFASDERLQVLRDWVRVAKETDVVEDLSDDE